MERRLERKEIILEDENEIDEKIEQIKKKRKEKEKQRKKQEKEMQKQIEKIIHKCEKEEVKNTKEKLKKIREAIKMIPEPKEEWKITSYVYYKEGLALEEEGKDREAIASYEKAREGKYGEGNGLLLAGLAREYYKLGERGKAREYIYQGYVVCREKELELENYAKECYEELLKESIERLGIQEKEEKYEGIKKVIREYKEFCKGRKEKTKEKERAREEVFGILLGGARGIEGAWELERLELGEKAKEEEIRRGLEIGYGIKERESLIRNLEEEKKVGMEGEYREFEKIWKGQVTEERTREELGEEIWNYFKKCKRVGEAIKEEAGEEAGFLGWDIEEGVEKVREGYYCGMLKREEAEKRLIDIGYPGISDELIEEIIKEKGGNKEYNSVIFIGDCNYTGNIKEVNNPKYGYYSFLISIKMNAEDI